MFDHYIPNFNHNHGISATMSFSMGHFNATLAQVVGENPILAEDLRIAFVESATRYADLMRRARCDANWRISAQRLQGLSATFGVEALVELADLAVAGAPGDPAIVRRIRAVIAEL